LRRGETAAALSYLRRAADAGSRSPFVHREYARLDPGHALAENAGSVTQTPGPQGTPSGGAAAPGSVLRGELGPSGEVVVDPAPVEADGSGERTIQARGRMRAISCRLQTPVIEI